VKDILIFAAPWALPIAVGLAAVGLAVLFKRIDYGDEP
jgi:hypothetical protein